MGELENKYYAEHALEDEAAAKARRILRAGARKILTNCYALNGQRYWIVGGRCLTPQQAEKLEDEMRREHRTTQPVIQV